MIKIYCNSCQTPINKPDVVFCSQCGVPLHVECANHCLKCDAILCDTCYASNSFMCDGCYKPDQEFKVIRRSHLELYAACPYALYLELVKGIKPEPNDYATLGSIIHNYLDLLSNHLLTINEAIIKATDQIHIDLSHSDKVDDFVQTAITSLTQFAEYQPLFGDKFNTEENIIFSLQDDLPMVSCTLDRIDFVGDDIHIFDWKTGKPMSGQKLITDLQPPLYIEAIHQKYGIYPKTFTLYYLVHNKLKVYTKLNTTHPTYEVQSGRNAYVLNIEEALNRTKDILKKINNKNFTMPKDIGQWYCTNMCSHYKTGICASSSKEQWKVLNDKYIAESQTK